MESTTGAMQPIIDHPRLKHAPIREAVVDFRARVPEEDVDGRMRDLCDSLADRYPDRSAIHQFHGQIRFDEAGIQAQEQAALRRGYRLTSADGERVVQIRRDGFTFSQLPPYESWDAMIAEAWPLWRRYAGDLGSAGVSRVATRFINVLPVTTGQPLARLLAAPPEIPEGLPSTVASFLFRYVTEATDGIASIVSLATEGSDGSSLVLDIDCFAQGDFSVANDMDAIRRILNRLRERKNAVFFNSIASEALKQWR